MPESSAPARARQVSPFLLLTLAPFFWACNWIIGRGMSTSVPPMAMTSYRWFFAVLLLAPFAWAIRQARLADHVEAPAHHAAARRG